MLYTSYLAKLNKIPDDSVKILITQWKGKIDTDKYNLIWKPELSPDSLHLWKNGSMTKVEMFEKFKEQLERKPSSDVVNEIIKYLEEDKDVYLICYCKELCECHRRLVALYISEKFNIEWKEYKGE